MFSSLIFYIFKIFGINELLLLNIGVVLSVLLGLGFKKDLYQDYLRSEKSRILDMFPRSKFALIFLKGLKYELIILMEIFIVFFSIIVSMMLSGFNVLLLTVYVFIYCVCFFISRNFILILTSNALVDSNVMNFLKVFLKSLMLAILLFAFGKLSILFEYIAGFGKSNEFGIDQVYFLSYIREFLFGQIKINVLLLLIILLILSYILKIICYSFYFNLNYS